MGFYNKIQGTFFVIGILAFIQFISFLNCKFHWGLFDDKGIFGHMTGNQIFFTFFGIVFIPYVAISLYKVIKNRQENQE